MDFLKLNLPSKLGRGEAQQHLQGWGHKIPVTAGRDSAVPSHPRYLCLTDEDFNFLGEGFN